MSAAPIKARRAAPRLIGLTAFVLLAGCAHVPGQDRLAEKDPLEKFNRGMWNVNMAADRVVMKPVTKVYRAVAPKPVRSGITNFFSNVTEPWSFLNNLLQGKPERAGRNLQRFVVNTTFGLAGLFDRATKLGVQPAPEDLGQTLAVWGVNGGPYLVLPLLGPSTMRDAVGSGVAAYGDPVNIAINHADVNVWYKRGYRAAGIVNARSELIESGGDAFLKSSLDPYAAARSAYLQRRRAQILDKEDDGGADLPGDDTPGEAVPTPAGGDAGSLPPKPAEAAAVAHEEGPAAAPATEAPVVEKSPEQGKMPPPEPVATPKE
ncbi:phospholipid-binding lipoprotein MlaA [Sphingomonas vulcanisoli]|uniref:Phospholipid-binding lipoprotein MlaA n=1 Tax=Sphingomonas vulcanisoli TaxID=1658060 RepID=A0ABX0TPZ0_9SPHN|nr:VacJ family lipoprotein [Sphingomonas vulcanisoli]NIJ06462.1 phospholipid-binding lipoprotein MlaA [Sphingomonas vulcanisoli]